MTKKTSYLMLGFLICVLFLYISVYFYKGKRLQRDKIKKILPERSWNWVEHYRRKEDSAGISIIIKQLKSDSENIEIDKIGYVADQILNHWPNKLLAEDKCPLAVVIFEAKSRQIKNWTQETLRGENIGEISEKSEENNKYIELNKVFKQNFYQAMDYCQKANPKNKRVVESEVKLYELGFQKWPKIEDQQGKGQLLDMIVSDLKSIIEFYKKRIIQLETEENYQNREKIRKYLTRYEQMLEEFMNKGERE